MASGGNGIHPAIAIAAADISAVEANKKDRNTMAPAFGGAWLLAADSAFSTNEKTVVFPS